MITDVGTATVFERVETGDDEGRRIWGLLVAARVLPRNGYPVEAPAILRTLNTTVDDFGLNCCGGAICANNVPGSYVRYSRPKFCVVQCSVVGSYFFFQIQFSRCRKTVAGLELVPALWRTIVAPVRDDKPLTCSHTRFPRNVRRSLIRRLQLRKFARDVNPVFAIQFHTPINWFKTIMLFYNTGIEIEAVCPPNNIQRNNNIC